MGDTPALCHISVFFQDGFESFGHPVPPLNALLLQPQRALSGRVVASPMPSKDNRVYLRTTLHPNGG